MRNVAAPGCRMEGRVTQSHRVRELPAAPDSGPILATAAGEALDPEPGALGSVPRLALGAVIKAHEFRSEQSLGLRPGPSVSWA